MYKSDLEKLRIKMRREGVTVEVMDEIISQLEIMSKKIEEFERFLGDFRSLRY